MPLTLIHIKEIKLMTDIRSILALGPVMPVIVIDNAEDAVPLAQALLAGGIHAIEVTLRTPAALDAMAAIARDVPDMVLGAGTVLDGVQASAARDAGAVFAVSPGATDDLISGCADAGIALLPGAASASEAMALYEKGFDVQKFFPAVPAGGAPFLKSLASPLPQISFCPTGGIGPANVNEFLSLPNVVCVGGSWIASAGDIAAHNWETITKTASQAASLTL